MGVVCSIILLAVTVTTIVVNHLKDNVEKKGKEDVENRMQQMNKDNTELKSVVDEQKRKIEENGKMIDNLKKELEQTYHTIEDISCNVKNQFTQVDIAFKGAEQQLDQVLDEIKYSQEVIISKIEELQSEVIEEMRNLEAEEIISQLKLIFSNFHSSIKQFNDYSIAEKISKLESKNDILQYLADTRVPKQDTLYYLLSYLMKREFVIPQNENDELSIQMLELLYNAAQMYIFVVNFVCQQYAFLGDYYYRKNNVEKHNHYYIEGMNAFFDFSNTLTGDIGLIANIINVLRKVEKLDFIQGSRKDVTEKIHAMFVYFSTIEPTLDSAKNRFQIEIPNKLNPNLDFSTSNISIPIFDWKNDTKVSYAIHLLGNSTIPFTMISPWSTGYTLDTLANPSVPIYRDNFGRTRVIFRKIGNGTPQIVATVQDGVRQVFRDIDRDLYNAACELNEDVALKNIRIYIENKANVNAAFENNRRAIHVTAENNKWNIAQELIKNGADYNVIDGDGYTPLHIASELGHEEFVEELLKLGADVNIPLSESKHKLTPLHSAVYKGQVGIANKLLGVSSININAQTTDGFSSLHYATYYDNEKITPLFFNDNRINFNAKSTKIEIPLRLSPEGTFDKETESLMHSGNVSPLHLASAFGSVDVLNEMIQKSSDLKSKTNDGSIALHFAALNKNEDIISSFKHLDLEDIVDTLNDREITPFYYAHYINNTEAASKLVDDHCANHNIRLSNHKTLLHLAAIYGHTSAAANLVDQASINVTARDVRGRTPLHYAVWFGNTEMIEVLLLKGASPNDVDNDGIPVSHMAINLKEDKALEVINLMGKATLNVNILGPHNNTLLHLFCGLEYRKVVNHLIGKNANVNVINQSKNHYYSTPLTIASWLGNFEIIKLLVQNKADFIRVCLTAAIYGKGTLKILQYFQQIFGNDVIYTDNDMLGAILKIKNDIVMYITNMYDNPIVDVSDEIINSSNFFLLKYLFEEANFTINANCGSTIYNMIYEAKASYEMVEYMLDVQKANINTHEDCGSLLQVALFNGMKKDVIEILIDRGAKSRTSLYQHTTELHLASERGLNQVVNHQLNNGLKEIINVKDNSGRTPLFIAIEGEGNLELIQTLIKEGAHLDPDLHNNTLVNAAARANKTDVAESFIDDAFLIDPSVANKDGFTPLHYAAMNNNKALVNKLLSSDKVDINAETNDKTTPIYEAIKNHGDLGVIDIFLKKGAKKTFNQTIGENLVSLAIEQKKIEVARALIVSRADVKTAGASKKTPLYSAINEDNPTMVKILLGMGADYNLPGPNGTKPIDLLVDNKSNTIKFFINEYRNKQKQTMLHLMASQNNVKVVQTLLERGAYVNAQDKDGNSPLHLAAKNGYCETVKMLCNIKQKCINVELKNVKKQTALDLAKLGNKTNVVDFLEHWHPNSTTNQRARRETVEQFSEQPVSSSAGRASWWVSDLVGAVVGTFGSITNEACQSVLSPSYYESRTESAQSISSLSASVNVHSTLLLLDVLARKFTGQSYVGTDSQSISPLDARSTSLDIVEQFERMLNRLANENNSTLAPELNSFELYRSVENCLLSSQHNKIDRILLSSARDAFPSDSIEDSLLVMSVKELLNEVLLGKKDSSLVETSSM